MPIAFLKIDGVEGESTAPRHFGEIELMSYSFGKNSQQMYALGAEQGDLSINLKGGFSFSKRQDKASRALMDACMTGRQFSEAVITTESVSEQGNLRSSAAFRLQNVTVSSFQTGSDSSSYEQATLDFEKAVNSLEQNADE